MSKQRRWSEDYVAHVLHPNFVQAKRYLFKPLLLVNKAHAAMLHHCGLLSSIDTSRILSALEAIEREGTDAHSYSEAFEDLYFAIEAKLIEVCGPEIGGNLQIARSRNDVDAAMIRMVLREALLGLCEALAELRTTLISRALEHLHSLMPGYTHHQPAQPTTLAHYLAASIACLERDALRLQSAYQTINRNPLGAAAMTTTAFPIRRELTAQYLGFDGLEENSIIAVGGVDHTLEALSAIAVCAVNLSRLTFDCLTWASREVDFLRVPDEFVQISSIMPQKRNPVVFEHVRAKLAKASGAAQTVFGMARNVPLGDVNDVGEPLLEPCLGAFTALDEAIILLNAVLEDAQFKTEHMKRQAGAHFTTATGLADALVAQHGLAFRQAHHVASVVVDLCQQQGIGPMEVSVALVEQAALTTLGRTLGIEEQTVREALDPTRFVAARKLPGGPATEAILPFLSRAQATLEGDEHWRRTMLERLRQSRDQLEALTHDLIELGQTAPA